MVKDICLNKNYIELWKDDLSSLEYGEKIRHISGEIGWQLTKPLCSLFMKYIEELNIKINIIAGPVISVEKNTRSNEVLNLAGKGLINLWISPFRQPNHYRIVGKRFIYRENYHKPMSKERCGKYIYDKYIVSKYIYDFDNLIKSLNLKSYKRKTVVAKKTNREINTLQRKLGENYDFLLTKQLSL